nr:ribonuclease H-like domain-containing protein [Tanacetum cinerariifolium]
MVRLDFKICAYDKNFLSIWTYMTMMLPRVRNHHRGNVYIQDLVDFDVTRTSKDNEDLSWSTNFKIRRTHKTSSALEVLWRTLFYLVVGYVVTDGGGGLCGGDEELHGGGDEEWRWTPIDTEKKIGPEGSPVTDPTLYCSLAGSLQYLTFTRPDLSYVFRSATSQLIAYSDAHWAGCLATRRSTFGYCVFLGDNLLTWSSKGQDTLSRSSAKAKFSGIANAVAETSWIRNLLRELHTLLFTATLVYCDNVSAVYMSSNPIQQHSTKHLEIDIHFVRDKVAAGHVRVLHVLS